MLIVADAPSTEDRLFPRDDDWLRVELEYLWSAFFNDVPRANIVEIAYAGLWKSRLGLITLASSKEKSYIRINGYLRLTVFPDFVVRATIAHEMVHYCHGFGSPLSQRYRYPHRGNVVFQELATRGLGHEHKRANAWLRQHWHGTVARVDREQLTRTLDGSPYTLNQELSKGLKVANDVPLEASASE